MAAYYEGLRYTIYLHIKIVKLMFCVVLLALMAS